MASAYPGGLDAFATNKTDGTTTPTDHPTHHNDLADAVNKIEAELGVDPAGASATVVARLDGMVVEVGGLEYSTPVDADGDNFKDGALHADWTETLDASVTAAEQNGAWRVSLNAPAGAGVSRTGYIRRTIAGLGTGDTAITCIEFAALTAELSQVEWGLEAGTDQVLMRVGRTAIGSVTLEAYRNVGGFTTFYLDLFVGMGSRLWLGIKWEGANTFGFHLSLDGELWAPVAVAQSATLTPTTVFLGANAFDAGGPMQVAYHFFDVVTTI